MWGYVISVIAIAISIVTFILTWHRRHQMDQLALFFSIDKDSDGDICRLQIEYDFLNTLFYQNPPEPPPADDIIPERLTKEQRAILNFGYLFLDYFQQMFLLKKAGVLPQGIWETWDCWMEEISHAPYFEWVWRYENAGDQYHPDMAAHISKYIDSACRH
jgi:hypothetical protein